VPFSRGINPLEARQAAKAAAAIPGVPSFGECALALIDSKRPGWRSARHDAQWTYTLKTYCAPIWDKPVDTIDLTAVLEILTPLSGQPKLRRASADGLRLFSTMLRSNATAAVLTQRCGAPIWR
jgi:hypothetical protein